MLKTHHYPSKLASWLVNLAILTIAYSVYAGGLEVPDLGTSALGRGTAFVAKADDLSAFYYNPAGLSKNTGHTLMLGVNLSNLNLDYLRTGNTSAQGPYETTSEGSLVYNPPQDYSNYWETGEITDYQSVKNGNPLSALPMLIYTWGDIAGVKGLAASAGLITPSGFGAPEYPKDGSQRYVLIKSNQLIVYPGLGLSYAVNRFFQIGGVFLSGIASLEVNQMIRLQSHVALQDLSWETNFNEDKENDIDFTIKVHDFFMPAGIIGVLSHPLDWLEVGLSVRTPVSIDAKGKITKFVPPPAASDAYIEKGTEDLSMSLKLPWIVRAGARYIHSRFDIEADYVFEKWSDLQEAVIETDAVMWINPATNDYKQLPPRVTTPLKYRDTHSVRLGTDIEVLPKWLIARVGGYFQSSAYPSNNETFSLFAPFGEQYGLGGGFTVHTCKYLDVHVAFLHVIQRKVSFDHGIIQQMSEPDKSIPENPKIVGNVVNSGEYDVNMNIFGITLEAFI